MNQATKTQVYLWKGKDKDGRMRKNELAAANEQLVKTYLQRQGITPISVIPKPKPLYESKGRVKAFHVVSFSRQLTTMLKAGMPITKALELIAEGIVKPAAYREMVLDIKDEVESGSSFSDALKKYNPKTFNDLYIALVKSGEEAGALDQTIEKIAINLEKTEAIKKKVKKALTYPAMVVIAAVVVTLVLLVKVIPVFEGFFKDFGSELPMLTQVVVAFSHAVIDWGWIVLVIFVALISFFFWYKKRNRNFQQSVNRFSFKIPILGSVLKLGAVTRFSRTLSVLFESGVPLITALEATGPATGSVIYEQATKEIKKDVENGAQLNFSMQETGHFDSFAVQMVGIGEESGNLGEMLTNVANFYEEELDYKIDNLTTMLEPLIIGFLALVVGTLVIAMYMPIFEMGNVVG